MKELFSGFEFARPYPVNYHETDAKLFQTHTQKAWPIYYELIHNLKINHELFVKKNIKILPLSFGDKWQDIKYNTTSYLLKNWIKNLFRSQINLDQMLWILDQFSTGGYYHWLTEILPRLWVANEVQKVPLDIPLYIPQYFFEKWPFGSALLKPFNRAYHKYQPRDLLKVTDMHFISQPGGPLAFQPQPLYGSTKLLINYYYRSGFKETYERIYISRNNGSKRLLLNEHDILPALKKKRFKVIYTDQIGIEDQINIFSRAKVLVSIHGAGLTNMVFMPRESTICEIRNPLPDHMNNCFLALADTLGHTYHYFIGERKPQNRELRPIDHSLEIDPNSFMKCLEYIDL